LCTIIDMFKEIINLINVSHYTSMDG
jgi:hypothetical protein